MANIATRKYTLRILDASTQRELSRVRVPARDRGAALEAGYAIAREQGVLNAHVRFADDSAEKALTDHLAAAQAYMAGITSELAKLEADAARKGADYGDVGTASEVVSKLAEIHAFLANEEE